MAFVFEWDETKRRKVLRERGIDFAEVSYLFDGPPLLTAPSPRADEDRWLSIGEIEGRIIAAIWVWRERHIRIITMRRARRAEAQKYHTAFG